MKHLEVLYQRIYARGLTEITSGFPMNPEPYPEVKRLVKDKDSNRLIKLANTPIGSGHSNALKGIVVRMVVRAPQYWWLQAERYHWYDIVSSQSKMHMIKNMNLDYQANEWVEQDTLDRLKEAIDLYNDWNPEWKFGVIDSSQLIFETKSDLFQYIISNTPMGFNLTADISTNYLQLKTMYHQRKNHKLIEWDNFKEWVENLPDSYLITGEKES